MDDIFEIREKIVCKKPQADAKTAFTNYELKAEDEFRSLNLPLNYVLFLTGGLLEISCNEFENRRIQPNQMILLLRTSSAHVRVLRKSMLYVMYFDTFLSSCDQQLFKSYLPYLDKIKYDFKPTRIPQPVSHFLKQIHYFQERKVDCMHYHNLKHREFFILLRHFCTREEVISFLYPLISTSLGFRFKVLEQYLQLGDGDVTKFAGLVGMGRKNFDKRFREEFNTSPAKWMQQEKAKRLRLYLAESGVTIADAMDEFNFNSASHFNRFCLQYFKMTPGKMIKEAQKEKKRKKQLEKRL